MADENSEKTRALDLTLSQIEKQFGKGSIMRLGGKDSLVPVQVISTGALSIDNALGVGGLPRGRVIEIFGPESSGKTTLALQVVAKMRLHLLDKHLLLSLVDAIHRVQQVAGHGELFRHAL